ncbi:HAD-IC family P-type ATPase [Salinisphaera sp. SPP-AMP-43]|uniref:cation-translocating P-type ATPase n=1 Tax=Salinisphaera sp. SPP-AMP-43 TaxID=3121288 RepID=UPI003C6E58D2
MDVSNWHALEPQQALQTLGSCMTGLSAGDARHRLRREGPNQLPIAPPEHVLRRLARQFKNVLIAILMLAGLATLAIRHWIDAVVIFGVILAMVLIGTLQEGRAEKALRAIQSLLARHTIVYRDGRLQRLPTDQIVPGDIVRLQAGDQVPADLRLLQAAGLRIDESPLTGESITVDKGIDPVAPRTPLAERRDMAFSGTHVAQGHALGVVVATGARTEIGRIVRLAENISGGHTPLMQQMADLSWKLTIAILVLAAVTFGFGWLIRHAAFEEAFLAAIALAVAAIPEGLPAVVTITLAIGVQRMARRNAIIRRLYAVETLGAVDVICSDKTGTLTHNQMMVRSVVLPQGQLVVAGDGYAPTGRITPAEPLTMADIQPDFERLLRAGVLCNDSALKSEPEWHVVGSATEGALLTLALKAGIDIDAARAACPRSDVLPFEPERRFMVTQHRSASGRVWIVAKGAPETLLARCPSQVRQGTDESLDYEYWQQCLDELTKTGQRPLAIAAAEMAVENTQASLEEMASNLALLGIVGIEDPPRADAIAAVAHCRAAGIHIKMITGDHAATAQAIGARFGLGQAGVLSGQDIDALDDAALRERTRSIDIYARTTPEHKLRLVKALQDRGCVVAMTGDGVNDAPALKQAEVGIAMGRRGTDTAREAAHIVLTDDNFVSIAEAVEQGRTVYDNIKKSVLFLVPTGLAEAMIVVLALLAGLTLPLTPLQILWVNTITATTLGLALAFEHAETDLMQRSPRGRRDSILSGMLAWRIVFVTLVIVAGTFGQFLWAIEHGVPVERARTIAINTVVMFEIAYLFSSRSIVSPVLNWRGLTGNRYVLIAIAITLVFQAALTYTPLLQTVFATRPLDLADWVAILGTASTVFILVELEKTILRRRQRRRDRLASVSV